MLSDSELTKIKTITSLFEYIKSSSADFYNEFCNAIVNLYGFHSSALFLIDGLNLKLLGKSNNVIKNINSERIYNCSVCESINNQKKEGVLSTSRCEIKISDPLYYESCLILNNGLYMLKTSKNSPFVQDDIPDIKVLRNFANSYLYLKSEIGKKSSFSENKNVEIFTKVNKELIEYSQQINGISSIIKNSDFGNKFEKYTNNLKINSNKITKSLNDLNSYFEGIKTEKDDLKTKILLAEMVSEVVKSVETFTAGDIDVHIKKDTPEYIFSNDYYLKEILYNLLLFGLSVSTSGNANVFIGASQDSNVLIQIKFSADNVDEKILQEIYEPFKIFNISGIKKVYISGLVLTLAKDFSDKIGVQLKTVKNSNNELVFELKIKGEAMSHLQNHLSDLKGKHSKNKILLVEDDYASSKLLNTYLKKWGYDPVIANDFDSAFSVIENESLMAIILDIEQPNFNGLELLKRFQENPRSKNLPVIVCSIEPEQQKAFMMGAVEYFVKPINYNFLVEVLTNYKFRQNSNILCVDDDIPTLNLIKRAIETAGYNAVAENISANVFNTIKNKEIDLAIVDLDMPHPNGFELIKLIKQEDRFKNLPIIIYTGKENFQEDLKQIDGLFEELLHKSSTNIEDLGETINQMINRYESVPPVDEIIGKEDSSVKILLAEDYKHSQIIVTRMLKKNNFTDLVVVDNGKEAYDMAKTQKFSLILMDMQMPIMNGFEATAAIRELPGYSDTPIIALTAFAMKGDREKCLQAGATDYIPKPIDSKEFIEKVKYYTKA